MPHAILLGDSILDNGAYVADGSPIVEQLRARLPRDWNVTLLARDGAVANGVLDQLEQLPADASHLIVSAGGNDALLSAPLLSVPYPDPRGLLDELVTAQTGFVVELRDMIRNVNGMRLPTLALTIYDAVPGLSSHERMALSLFNDVIVREWCDVKFPILDLRRVCTDARDYSAISPIEPSEIGGAKIVRAIQSVLLTHEFAKPHSTVYP